MCYPKRLHSPSYTGQNCQLFSNQRQQGCPVWEESTSCLAPVTDTSRWLWTSVHTISHTKSSASHGSTWCLCSYIFKKEGHLLGEEEQRIHTKVDIIEDTAGDCSPWRNLHHSRDALKGLWPMGWPAPGQGHHQVAMYGSWTSSARAGTLPKGLWPMVKSKNHYSWKRPPGSSATTIPLLPLSTSKPCP